MLQRVFRKSSGKARVNRRRGTRAQSSCFGLQGFAIYNNTHKAEFQCVLNSSSICSLMFISQAFCHAFVVENFVETVSEKHFDDKTREVMTSLCQLYGVHGIITNLGEFIQVNFHY